MEFIIGKDKFPLIKFEDSKYAHILPVTKYQFERYIWENALNINYKEIIKGNPRITPYEVNTSNLNNLFITEVSFTGACNYCFWGGGRLPLKSETNKISNILSSINIKEFLDSVSSNNEIDKRCLVILKTLLSKGSATMDEVHKCIRSNEFFTELPVSFNGNFGGIYTGKLNEGYYSQVTGKKDDKICIKGNYVFRLIAEEN